MQHDPQKLKAAKYLVDLYGPDAANVAEKQAMLSGKRPLWLVLPDMAQDRPRDPRNPTSCRGENLSMSVVMANPTPEDRARAFAARWFKHQSRELQEIGRREIAALIREAIEAEKAQSSAEPSASEPKIS